MLLTEWVICITYPALICPISSRHLGYNQGWILCFVISNAHYPTSTTFPDINKGLNKEVVWYAYQITYSSSSI